MSSNYRVNYINGVVICHGKSEWIMSRFISSNLHLRIKSYAKDNGKHSIQITSIMNILNTKPFDKKSSFLSEYSVEEVGKGKNRKLINFKLFIIMDTDDCSEQQKNDFISKKMFEGHWLYDYISPIANIPSLEDVLVETGMMSKKLRDDEKCQFYLKVFPINGRPLSNDTLNEVKTLKNYISKSEHTNLQEYIDYCLSLLP